jgi:hypothetical protein
MDIVFDDDNARVLRSVHNELVSAVQDDVVAVARIECHQGVTTTKCLGPSGEMISKFELGVVGDGVEIVVAVDQAGQTLLDDVEERVERRECRVLTPQEKLTYPNRSEAETQILVLLAKRKLLSADKIAEETGMSTEVTQFHLDELFRADLVEWETEGTGARGTVWKLGHIGVGYLVERGLHE